MAEEAAGGVLLRFPLERRLAAVRAEQTPHTPADGRVEYVNRSGWFGVRIRPALPDSGNAAATMLDYWAAHGITCDPQRREAPSLRPQVGCRDHP